MAYQRHVEDGADRHMTGRDYIDQRRRELGLTGLTPDQVWNLSTKAIAHGSLRESKFGGRIASRSLTRLSREETKRREDASEEFLDLPVQEFPNED